MELFRLLAQICDYDVGMVLFEPRHRFVWESKCEAGWHEPLRRIYDCELFYASEGRFVLNIEEARHEMRAGSIAIIPPATWHESWVEPKRWVMRHCLHFDWTDDHASSSAPLFSFAGDDFVRDQVHWPPTEIMRHLPLVSHKEDHDDAIEVMDLVFQRVRRENPMGGRLLWAVLRRLLDRRAQPVDSPSPSGKPARSVFALKEYIDRHYTEALDYSAFCRVTGLSQSHLCHVFRRWIGRPPHTYLNDVRLHHARRLLKTTAMNVAEAARTVGIHDANYFSRLFRKRFGMTPSAFIASGSISPTISDE